MGKSRDGKKKGKTYGAEFTDKSARRASVDKSGQDPLFEAEMHNLVAEQNLLQLLREAAEKEAAEKGAAAAAQGEEALDAHAAGAPGEGDDAAAGAPGEGDDAAAAAGAPGEGDGAHAAAA